MFTWAVNSSAETGSTFGLQGPFMFTKLCYDVDQATFTVDSGPTQYQSRPICWVWSGMELPALIEKRVCVKLLYEIFLHKDHLKNRNSRQFSASLVGNESDYESQGCWFVSHCKQDVFLLYLANPRQRLWWTFAIARLPSFGGVCVLSFGFRIFCWHRGFCHRTVSDNLLCLSSLSVIVSRTAW